MAWGLNFVVIKTGMADIPPMLLGALRFMLAAFPAILFVPRPPAAAEVFADLRADGHRWVVCVSVQRHPFGHAHRLACWCCSRRRFHAGAGGWVLKEHWGGTSWRLAAGGVAAGADRLGPRCAHAAGWLWLTLAAATMGQQQCGHAHHQRLWPHPPAGSGGVGQPGAADLRFWLCRCGWKAQAIAQALTDFAGWPCALAYLAWVLTLFGYSVRHGC